MSDYPSTLADLLMWVDGRGPVYSDTAGTVVATPFAGRVRRVNYGSPAVGNAQALSDATRPFRETNSLNFEMGEKTFLSAPVASNCVQNAVTFAAAFSLRNNPPGAVNLLLGNGALQFLTFSDNIVDVSYNAGGSNWLVGPGGEPYARCGLGKQIEVVIRLEPTRIRASVVVDGVRTDYSITTTVNSTTLTAANWGIGGDGTTQDSRLQGALAQMLLIGHVSSDAENDGLLAFMRANPAPYKCPTAVPLVTVSGDSIAACSFGVFGVPIDSRWSSLAQQILNQTQPVNVINAAISGDAVVHQRDVVFPAALQPFIDPTRSKNVCVLAAGTNDIATMHHDGPTVFADITQAVTNVKAAGGLPVVCTILARGGAAGFDVEQAYVNAHIRSQATAQGYKVADFAAIPELQNVLDTTYYSDQTHPTIAGHVLLAPVAAAAIQEWLTVTPDPPPTPSPGLPQFLTIDRQYDAASEPTIYLFSLRNSAAAVLGIVNDSGAQLVNDSGQPLLS